MIACGQGIGCINRMATVQETKEAIEHLPRNQFR
jgi:hypothetical protein